MDLLGFRTSEYCPLNFLPIDESINCTEPVTIMLVATPTISIQPNESAKVE